MYLTNLLKELRKKATIMIKTEKKEFISNDRYRFSNGKTSYDYEKERAIRLKERKRVKKILSYDYFSNNKEVNNYEWIYLKYCDYIFN